MHRIGGFAVERTLGEGGMGTVFLARTRGGRAVAVKVAKPELAADPLFRERFRAEVAAARTVGGFHTAPVVEADVDGNPPWLATAYIPGPTLAEQLATWGPMSEPQLRILAAALAEALASVHACGLVHRDLKPGNIIMAGDGPRVLDFGIARALETSRLTATGTAFGTPGYLSPEQALGQDVTGASDVFALGSVLVAAAGGSAWGEGNSMALMYRSVHESPDLTAVPPGLRHLISACLHKDPAARPTPNALLDAIAGREHHKPGGPTPTLAAPTPPTPPAYPPTQPARPPALPSASATPQPEQLVIGDLSASLTADSNGITLRVDADEADFEWPEISAITCSPDHRGRFTATVHLHDGTSYPCELNARRTNLRNEWINQLHHIVSCYLPR
ncbi:serine/threonine-protein kinase [Streptomyces tropicalis]|uniref:Serine/threonine-protein kinase n=1 Tax=Streptomyces tropicalis TaxID=3034234 RepID=A0ABT6A609_9ACTN|nr:serine/threonine-protein kinase [Streptomyces tropicalis]MDF3300077.1 serine/threonine-protein kinase [Streptomyces tropicalis]